jgi:hypothetical protein
MKLGIPTLCRYDLLKQLIRSAERGSLRPSGYIIVDNGGKLSREEILSWLSPDARPDFRDLVELITPDSNLGVAASWNLIIDRAAPEPVIISNDDVDFGSDTFLELVVGLGSHEFVEGEGWALFGQRFELIKKVGYYDENFWPAYYEDVDYDARLARAGVAAHRPLSVPVQHHGWATTTALADADWLKEGRARNHAYFLAKWGGESRNPRWNGNSLIFQYETPFGGKPPPGWNERKRMTETFAMRWDVLNLIAKTIGAETYLEIGVNDGECIKRIEVREKWGVDPNPTGDAIRHSDVLIPRTSAHFFSYVAPRLKMKFDLVFIDGDHHAEIVYDEVQNARAALSPKGVICLHDCNPHTEEMQRVPMQHGKAWTGDVWKTVARLRSEGNFKTRVVPFDYGTAILVPVTDGPGPSIKLPCDWDRLLWKDLLTDRANLLGLLEPGEWDTWINRIPTLR